MRTRVKRLLSAAILQGRVAVATLQGRDHIPYPLARCKRPWNSSRPVQYPQNAAVPVSPPRDAPYLVVATSSGKASGGSSHGGIGRDNRIPHMCSRQATK